MPSAEAPNLMVNPDGSVYHIRMRPEDLADTVIVVGDPHRVSQVGEQLSGIDHQASNREFNSVSGYYNGKRITVLSTGIGTDNCDIVMHELDALANFNLQTREKNPAHRALTIIRLGTSGAIQADIPVGSFALSTHAAGLDNLLYFYRDHAKVIDREMTEAFASFAGWPAELSKPYFVAGSERLIALFREKTVAGITVTAPGFYGPQGRFLRLPLTDPGMVDRFQGFTFQGHRIINFEMETSAIYGLGRLMGHETLTLCAIIANRATGDYDADHKLPVKKLIGYLLDRITSPRTDDPWVVPTV